MVDVQKSKDSISTADKAKDAKEHLLSLSRELDSLKILKSPAGDLDETNSATPAASKMSVSLEILEGALVQPISALFQMNEDGKPYEKALLDHFHENIFDKSQPALGNTYKLFAMIAGNDTLETLLGKWNTLADPPKPVCTAIDNSMDDFTYSLINSLTALSQDVANSLISEAKLLKKSIRGWQVIWKLEMHKVGFEKLLDEWDTLPERLDRINEHIMLLQLDNGPELCAQGASGTLKAHLDRLYYATAISYGLGEEAARTLARRGLVVRHLVELFGNGILAIIALDGFKALLQNIHLPTVSMLARFTKEGTKAQLLLDHVSTHLVKPCLSGKKVGLCGVQRFEELWKTNDWSCLNDAKDSDGEGGTDPSAMLL